MVQLILNSTRRLVPTLSQDAVCTLLNIGIFPSDLLSDAVIITSESFFSIAFSQKLAKI